MLSQHMIPFLLLAAHKVWLQLIVFNRLHSLLIHVHICLVYIDWVDNFFMVMFVCMSEC